MGAIDFEVQIERQKELNSYLTKAAKRLKDLRPALEKSGIAMERSIALNFQAEGRPARWAPLAPWTQWVRDAKGYGREHPILRQTNTLASSITSNIIDSGSAVETGTNISYAKLLQEGGTNSAGKHVPARPFVLFQPDDITEIERIFDNEVERDLR